MSARPLLAIFVGGKSRRMGRPKGLLEAPGTGASILESLVSCGRASDFAVALVGDAEPYTELAVDVPRIADDPPGAGPLAGLHAALRVAVQQRTKHVVAVACDMPFVSPEALAELTSHPSGAVIVAPRRAPEDPWEPMLARYDAQALVDVLDAALADGCRSFQKLFALVEVEALPLTATVARALEDWDAPQDIGA